MKAIRITRTGGPEVLEYTDLPTPVPGPTQVLVRAHAIGVNMPEVMVRKGTYSWMPPLPAIPGIEMSGTVVATGDEVKTLRTGQKVYVSARELAVRAGCYAEYIAVDAAVPYVLPDGADLDAAATLANYQVAWHLLHSATRGFKYESVLVTAAGGGIGSAAVQLARAAGKRVVATARSAEKAAFALSQGADAAINTRDPDADARIAAATRGFGVDLLLDPVGGPGFAALFDHLAPLGLAVLYGSLDGWPGAELPAKIRERQGDSLGMRMFSMHTFDHDRAARARCTDALIGLLARGEIRPAIHDRIPLADVARAHTLLESGKVFGKLVLKP